LYTTLERLQSSHNATTNFPHSKLLQSPEYLQLTPQQILLSLLLITSTQALLPVTQQPFAGTRITIHSDQNFTTVTSALYVEIGLPANAKFPAIVENITSYNATEQALFISEVEAAVGPHGFMIFAVS
jgi:hypothetical protein